MVRIDEIDKHPRGAESLSCQLVGAHVPKQALSAAIGCHVGNGSGVAVVRHNLVANLEQRDATLGGLLFSDLGGLLAVCLVALRLVADRRVAVVLL